MSATFPRKPSPEALEIARTAPQDCKRARRLARAAARRHILNGELYYPNRPPIVLTITRTIGFFGNDIEQWFTAQGGFDLTDPAYSSSFYERCHARQLSDAARARRLGMYRRARECIERARSIRCWDNPAGIVSAWCEQSNGRHIEPMLQAAE